MAASEAATKADSGELGEADPGGVRELTPTNQQGVKEEMPQKLYSENYSLNLSKFYLKISTFTVQCHLNVLIFFNRHNFKKLIEL